MKTLLIYDYVTLIVLADEPDLQRRSF